MLGQDLEKVFTDLHPVVWDKEDLNITDSHQVLEKIKELQPGTVISAAAYNLVDDAESDEGFALAKKVNGEGPKNLAAACTAIKATFVHYSTDYVFDGTKKEGYREDDAPNPQSKYAESKLLGEQNALKEGENVYVVRTCKLFGQPGTSEGSKKSFVDVMLWLSESKDELDVVDEELASPTYTPDLAKQTRFLLEGRYAPGIYHVTNSNACTWYEFAEEIFRQAGKKMRLNKVTAEAFPRPAARPKFSILLNTKLPMMRSWQEALSEYLNTRKG